MADSIDDAPASQTSPTATQKLAELVAERKQAAKIAAQARHRGQGVQSERAAAARSASKSKPAMRK